MQDMQDVISALALETGKVLLVNKRGVWILPGGKPGLDEDSIACLKREMKEELPFVDLKIQGYFKNFVGISPHRKGEINVLVYNCLIEGDISSAQEISAAEWVHFSDLSEYNLSKVTREILDDVKNHYHIKI